MKAKWTNHQGFSWLVISQRVKVVQSAAWIWFPHVDTCGAGNAGLHHQNCPMNEFLVNLTSCLFLLVHLYSNKSVWTQTRTELKRQQCVISSHTSHLFSWHFYPKWLTISAFNHVDTNQKQESCKCIIWSHYRAKNSSYLYFFSDKCTLVVMQVTLCDSVWRRK